MQVRLLAADFKDRIRMRIHRRLIDRILSMFIRLRRFRCTHIKCHWEDNLRERTPDRSRPRPLWVTSTGAGRNSRFCLNAKHEN